MKPPRMRVVEKSDDRLEVALDQVIDEPAVAIERGVVVVSGPRLDAAPRD
jgi:hypothetical protein